MKCRQSLIKHLWAHVPNTECGLTMHKLGGVHMVCCNSGCVVRRSKGMNINTVTIASGKSKGVKMTVESLCTPIYSAMPFTKYHKPPRPTLEGIRFTQAVTREPTGHSNTLLLGALPDRPHYNSTTQFAKDMDRLCESAGTSMPGIVVRMLYHNHPLNYEDALLINRKSVESGLFTVLSCPEDVLDGGC